MVKRDWYSPASIIYTKAQIRWILLNVAGRESWPSNHKETGYTGEAQTSRSSHAYFELTKIITGELGARLKACGIDGLLLSYLVKTSEGDDISVVAEIASILREDPERIQERIDTAFKYCKGEARKMITYHRYCIKQKSYEKH